MGRITEILVVPHTHHDVGYTHTPRTILPLHWRAVREAIRLSEEPNTDQRAAFRWTMEVARPVLQFLKEAEPAEVDQLRVAVQTGHMSITGGYLNMTQLVGHEELARFYEPVDLLRQAGLPVRVVQHSDVNGVPWGTVSAMRRAGLDTLVMGLNPDHGRPPLRQPSAFRWVGPDGSEVLVWLSDHYGNGQVWGMLDRDIDRAEPHLLQFVADLEARTDYPFEVGVVHATDDNGWPTNDVVETVRLWNIRHPELSMRTATIDQAMDVIRAQAEGATLPVLRGEWADWWAHGHGSSAHEVALSRRARSMARAGEAAWSLARLNGWVEPETERCPKWRRSPVRFRSEAEITPALAEVYDDLLLFEEHTWGADESVSRPESTFTHSHWNAQASFAYAAYDHGREICVEAIERLTGAISDDIGRSLAVFNPSRERRSEPMIVNDEGVDIQFVARDLPGLSLTVLDFPTATMVQRESGTVLDTDAFRVEVNPAAGGVTSLIDKRLGWELVDQDAPEPFAAVIYEDVPGDRGPQSAPFDRRQFGPDHPAPDFVRAVGRGTSIPTIEHGADWSAISWETRARTLPRIRTRLCFYEGLDFFDVSIELSKEAHYASEGVYVAFPFALARPTYWLETAGAVYRAGTDQLPDTCRDWYSIQHGMGVTDGERSVLFATAEAPLVQLGAIHTGQWARELDAPVGHVYSWLMNNLYFTNFKASQHGNMRFAYRVSPRSGAVGPADVHTWGECAALAVVQQRLSRRDSGTTTWLAVDSPDVICQALTPEAAGRSARLRLQSTSDVAHIVTVRWSGATPISVWQCDAFGNRQRELAGDGRIFRLNVGAHDLVTLALQPVDDVAAPHRHE